MSRLLIFVLALCSVGALPEIGVAAEFESTTLDDGTEAILITGNIEQGDEENFRELSIRFKQAIIALDSDGGALLPALEIGRMIKLRDYSTIVMDDQVCLSSCALIWMAGKRRILSSDGLVGFHASYINADGSKVESGVANALIGHYLSQLNASSDAVIFATLAAPDEIAWLTIEDEGRSSIQFEAFHSRQSSSDTNSTPLQNRTTRIPEGGAETSTFSRIKSLFQQDGMGAASARSIGASGSLIAPLANHFEILLSNDALLQKAASEIDSARIDIDQNPSAVATILYQLTSRSVAKGMGRLPQRDLNRMFEFYSFLAVNQHKDCSKYSRPESASISEFETVFQAGEPYLIEYLGLIRKAMLAEIENSLPVQVLQKSQIDVAENAMAEIVAETVEDWEPHQVQYLSELFQNLETAEPSEQCMGTKFLIPIIADMDGLAGDWMRRTYVTQYLE